MKITVDQLIKSFESKTQNKKERYNDFLYHCFQLFEKLINDNKNKRKKDKYVIMRQNLINYLIANERKITSKLCR
tara:strand:+ start:1402 stop:1626 length:225 start_codon:yes stop_codon:yes gene_type:complete